MPQGSCLVNYRLALLAEARVLSIVLLNPHPGRLLALGTNHGNRRHRNRSRALKDATFGIGALTALFEVPLHQPQPFHLQAPGLPVNAHHLAAFAGLVLLGGFGFRRNLNRVSNLELLHQSTSREREMIFMNFRARSSRATGPKIRVPTGSRSLVINTAELPSNLMKLPSGLPTSRLVRTITALATSPFLTFEFGSASRIDTTMMSPIEAYLRFEPPRTLMQKTFFAPELSATSSTLVI